jgi:hypothetical protein
VEIYAKEFSLAKGGNSERENEDAWKAAKDKSRFAVADGATETSFSGAWARQLVRAFAKGDLSIPLAIEELKPLQSEWWQNNVHRRPLPWYAEEKANDGAFAAFIGLEFLKEDSEPGTKNAWRATAVGDSCLIQIRENEILKAFPLADSASFDNHPSLLSSAPVFNEDGKKLIMKESGSWRCDDVFLLMTDALACWFFKEGEQGKSPWDTLRDLHSDDSFKELIANLRGAGRMKNDDVTLVRLNIRA